jgi:hypothetical protein
VNIGASVASHAGTWYTYTFPFATKNEFDSNDEYEVLMNASTSDSGQTPQDRPLCISNIKVSEVTPPDPSKLYSTGVQGNRLAPDSDYRIKVAGLKTYPHGGSQNLFVRLVTEPSPLVGHGVPNTRWGYVWDERRWVPSTFTSDSQWKKLEFTAAKEEIHPFEFNTKNYRTPLGYLSLASGVDLIHTSSTAYYLEFAKSEADETNGVTLLGVELVNVNMNNLLEDYTKDDFLTVFSYFDDLGVSKLSRDISKSASEYGTSGGSRSEYMEFYGGSVSASDGVYEFIEDEG